MISDTIYVMLLRRELFASFTPLEVADAKEVAQVLVCLSADTPEGVAAIAERAVAADGAVVPRQGPEAAGAGRPPPLSAPRAPGAGR